MSFYSKKALFTLAALAVLGIAPIACSSGDRESTDDNATGAERNPDQAALSAVAQQPHTAACADSSARFHCKARVRSITMNGKIKPFAAPSGLGPADLKSAYKIDTTKNPNATIAIVDAFGYKNAESDLATYRSTFGLPACTVAGGCLKIVNSSGGSSLPAQPTASDDWTVETALDLDMASSACPTCKILLVQATSDQDNSLFDAQQTAAGLGATVISDSWGGSDPTPSNEEHYFQTSPAVGIFVSSGDNGYTGSSPDYPSTSAFVTAVGGTSLTKSGNSRGWAEGAWSGAGSSCSNQIAKPSYQGSTGCSFRAASDVSAVADPNTGVAVYNNGPSSSGWIVVGGTSASSPFVAGVYALYSQGKVGPSYSYGHTSQYFDVTSGSNGSCSGVLCNAGTGWDGPTGIGSPNGAVFGGGGTCTPSCGSKVCGDDGCGGSCGTCATGQTCSSSGTCTGGGGGGTCSHSECSSGTKLTSSCSTCATSVCSYDSYCCTTKWDSWCALEAQEDPTNCPQCQ